MSEYVERRGLYDLQYLELCTGFLASVNKAINLVSFISSVSNTRLIGPVSRTALENHKSIPKHNKLTQC